MPRLRFEYVAAPSHNNAVRVIGGHIRGMSKGVVVASGASAAIEDLSIENCEVGVEVNGKVDPFS